MGKLCGLVYDGRAVIQRPVGTYVPSCSSMDHTWPHVPAGPRKYQVLQLKYSVDMMKGHFVQANRLMAVVACFRRFFVCVFSFNPNKGAP